MTVKKKPAIAFEAAVAELENVVGQIEQGELTLEESLRRFERGVALVGICQTLLREAEQKVEQLVDRGGQTVVVPFAAPTD